MSAPSDAGVWQPRGPHRRRRARLSAPQVEFLRAASDAGVRYLGSDSSQANQNVGGADRAALPLIIGVVLIEIEFVRFNNRLRARMVTVYSIVELRRASVGALLSALCRYLLFCGVFAAGLGALATGGGPFAGST